MDGLECWALDIPVELFEVEGEIDRGSHAGLEDVGLSLGFQVVWEVHGVLLDGALAGSLGSCDWILGIDWFVASIVSGVGIDNAVNCILAVHGVGGGFCDLLCGEVGRVLDGFDHCSDLEWFFEE